MTRLLLRWPFTITFLAVMLICAVASGSIFGSLPDPVLQRYGVSLNGFLEGRFYTLISSIFLSRDAGMFAKQIAFAAIVISLVEMRWGSRRAATWFFLSDFAGTLTLFFGVIWPLSHYVPGFSGLAAQADVGMSGGGFFFNGLIAGLMVPKRYRLLAIGLLYLWIAATWFIEADPLADTLHFITLSAAMIAQKAFPSFLQKQSD